MKSSIYILYLEDDLDDVKLIKSTLLSEKIDCKIVHVSTKTDYIQALEKEKFDMILADYSLPQFDGLTALKLAKDKYPDIPFILISGTIGEEFAIEALKAGATDYVLKQRLSRLIPATHRALKEVEEQAKLKRADEALRKSEEKYRNLVDNAPVGVYKTNLKGDILYANDALARMLEFESTEEMMSESVLSIYKNLKDRDVLIENLKKTGRVEKFETELLTKTEKTKNVLLSAIIEGEVMSGMITDITERKQADEKLKEEKTFIENALNTLKDIFFVFDLEGRFLRWNKTMNAVSGYSDKEISSMKPTDFFLQEDTSRIAESIERVVNEGSGSVEATIITKDGRRIPYEFNGALLKDHEGNPTGICGVGRDISERKQAEGMIKKQLRHITSLRNIDMAITGSIDMRITLQIFLDEAISQLHVDAATVLLFKPYTNSLEYVAGRGLYSDALKHTKLLLGEGHAGRAAVEKSIISIQNLSKDTNSFSRSPLFVQEGFISYYAVPLIAKGHVKGVLEIFHRTPFEADNEWLDFLEGLATQAAIAIDNATLFEDLHRSNIELSMAYDATIEGWSKALDLRDKETEGHSQRVTEMTVKIAHNMGVSDAELVHIRRGALLHDIGKMGIPDSILLKPGRLNDEEWKIMYKHPVYAYELLSPITFLRPALDIPYYHHEKWDGTGYPLGLRGEQIPLAARIFALVDVWDALNSERPYRPALPEEKVREYLRDQIGKHFDPKVVEVFLKVLNP